MKKGFSLIELLIVIALIMILILVIFSNFYKRKSTLDLDLTTKQIASILNEARSRAISQDKDSQWGVYFANSTSTQPFYALFYSTYYSTSTTVKKYTLPNFIYYSTSSIPLGGSLTVLFQKLSGDLQTGALSKTINLNLIQNGIVIASSSININQVGRISY